LKDFKKILSDSNPKSAPAYPKKNSKPFRPKEKIEWKRQNERKKEFMLLKKLI
jgi:hypothetical protein